MTKTKITAWSISRLQVYNGCPLKAKYKFIDGYKEPGSKAGDRGTEIHKKLEDYLTGKSKRLPVEAKLLEKEFKLLKAKKPEVELSLAFTANWETTQWFGNTAWCRVKVDALVPPTVENATVQVLDNKTGKLKESGEYDDQLSLYALAGLIAYPVAERVETKLLFVDHGKEVSGGVIERKNLEVLKKQWNLKVKVMLSDTRFKKKPGFACQWCHFRKSNGGPCDEG